MARDFTVVLANKPGMLADLGEAVGRAGINLSGGCGSGDGDEGVIHLLVEDGAEDARSAIEGAGLEVRHDREVLVVDVQDSPGTLGSYARKLAEAGVNIDLFYIATRTRLVFGVDDMERARAAVG
jgi:hypothetical protein